MDPSSFACANFAVAGGKGQPDVVPALRPGGDYAVASGARFGPFGASSPGIMTARDPGAPGSRLNVTTLRFGLKWCFGEADNTRALMGDERLLHLYRGRS